jgi:ribosome biogenesis GTPase
LIILENGGLLIEKYCHFSDCTHTSEIKCAVIDALKNGLISEERYKSYLKLQKELRYLETKQNKFSYLDSKKKMKSIRKASKNFYKKNFKLASIHLQIN